MALDLSMRDLGMGVSAEPISRASSWAQALGDRHALPAAAIITIAQRNQPSRRGAMCGVECMSPLYRPMHLQFTTIL